MYTRVVNQQPVKMNTDLQTVLLLASVIACTFVSKVECGVLKLPEFVEPIKNNTLPAGSDVEFSCEVRDLGTYRVTWSWKKDDVQKFLAIGIVKITHNPRVVISRIQKSDDVTQFNLYVYNVKKEDEGQYFCNVNSNPMIEQIGTLDVIDDDPSIEDTKLHPPTNGKIFSDKSAIPLLTEESETSGGNSTTLQTSSANNTSAEDSTTVLCIDFGEIWENARERISELLSALMKLTYSYWFS